MHAGNTSKGCFKIAVPFFFGLCGAAVRAAAAAYNISTEAERGTHYRFFPLCLRYYYCCFLRVCSITVAVGEKGYIYIFLIEVLPLLIIFLVGCAAAAGAAGACAAYNISTEAERGTGYCFFLLRCGPLHCDLRTPIAAVVLDCFYFCLLKLRCFGYVC